MAVRNLPILSRLQLFYRGEAAPEDEIARDPRALGEALVKLVEENDVAGLRFLAGAGGPTFWTTLHPCERETAYPNDGTLVHWAIWHRRWAIVALACSLGADLTVAGRGCWMEGRTAQAYAAFLDSKAGHPFYRHAESFAKAAANSEDMAELGSIMPLPTAGLGSLEDPQVRALLCDMIDRHCISGLEKALGHFGAPALGRVLVGPSDNPYNNQATLAHFAVWAQDWSLLRWLVEHGCAPTDVAGEGRGWVSGQTLEQYADYLDEKCRHPFYSHRVHLAKALRETPAVAVVVAAEVEAGGGQDHTARCCCCLDQPADWIFRPCNHLCLCSTDALLFPVGSLCPICRAPATEVPQRVYMA